ncbi:hypothetical protein RHGRI_022536 [Rhododendron griersonianum]|uniref:Secreted protein n=1 Tax=Rhododendron griersonianum TaxID=479676 RepID=A0AAV6J3S2_9ERIC|nr:hypothetical protein RHGRI_022536 [Rhododendron griersonianum]
MTLFILSPTWLASGSNACSMLSNSMATRLFLVEPSVLTLVRPRYWPKLFDGGLPPVIYVGYYEGHPFPRGGITTHRADAEEERGVERGDPVPFFVVTLFPLPQLEWSMQHRSSSLIFEWHAHQAPLVGRVWGQLERPIGDGG